MTTMGHTEWHDVEVIVDWLVQTKGTGEIGLLANSMGARAALAAAAEDARIGAVVLDSAHARLEDVVARRLDTEMEPHHPAYPGAWAVVIGTSIRIGADVTALDPVRTIPQLGERPLLLTHGSADVIAVPGQGPEVNREAAERAGVDVTVKYCEGAPHGKVVDACPDAFGDWATDFFDAALG
jgi:pimeloyl-ACP methyl ester carboxylesterase